MWVQDPTLYNVASGEMFPSIRTDFDRFSGIAALWRLRGGFRGSQPGRRRAGSGLDDAADLGSRVASVAQDGYAIT
jgi:hypothetical protein